MSAYRRHFVRRHMSRLLRRLSWSNNVLCAHCLWPIGRLHNLAGRLRICNPPKPPWLDEVCRSIAARRGPRGVEWRRRLVQAVDPEGRVVWTGLLCSHCYRQTGWWHSLLGRLNVCSPQPGTIREMS